MRRRARYGKPAGLPKVLPSPLSVRVSSRNVYIEMERGDRRRVRLVHVEHPHYGFQPSRGTERHASLVRASAHFLDVSHDSSRVSGPIKPQAKLSFERACMGWTYDSIYSCMGWTYDSIYSCMGWTYDSIYSAKARPFKFDKGTAACARLAPADAPTRSLDDARGFRMSLHLDITPRTKRKKFVKRKRITMENSLVVISRSAICRVSLHMITDE
jgi:hypothetical protein